MEFTGERLIMNGKESEEIQEEHLARYEFAKRFVENKIVLDIATGMGYGAAMMAAAGAKMVYGGDIDKESIQLAQQNYPRDNLHFQTMTAAKLPFPDNYFEVTVCFETIEHIQDYRGFLKEIFRVLLPGGKLILSTPNRKVTRKLGIKNPYHIKEFTVEELITILAECQKEGVQVGDLNQQFFRQVKLFGQREVKVTGWQRIKIELYLLLKMMGALGILKKIKVQTGGLNQHLFGLNQQKIEWGAGDFHIKKWEEGKEYLYIIIVAGKRN